MRNSVPISKAGETGELSSSNEQGPNPLGHGQGFGLGFTHTETSFDPGLLFPTWLLNLDAKTDPEELRHATLVPGVK